MGNERQEQGRQRGGWGRKQEQLSRAGQAASETAPCTGPAPPHCLQKEASSVVRPPQAPWLPPPELNEILVQSCGRWGLAAEAPQSFCSHPKGGLSQGWGPGS